MPKILRIFLVFLLFLRLLTFFSTKPTLKIGDRVQITGRMTQEAKIWYSQAFATLNDRYVVQVSLKLIKTDLKTLMWRKMMVAGEITCEKKTENENNCRQIIIAEKVEIFPEDDFQKILMFFENSRNQTKNMFYRLYPRDEAEIMNGVLLGQSKNVSRELLDAFYKTGTIHLFAASGMNLILVCGFLRESLNILFKKRRALILAISAAIFYVFLSGFSASILRASVMFIFVNLAEIFGRVHKGLYSLGVAAGILIFVSPEILFNLGFQLSVMSTVGMMVAPKAQRRIENYELRIKNLRSKESKTLKPENPKNQKLLENVQWGIQIVLKGIETNFLVSTCCFVMTAPLIMFAFGKINLISPLANIFVLWMIEWIMMLGGLSIVFNWVIKPFNFLLNFLVFITSPFLFAFKWMIVQFSKLDFGVINLDYGASAISFLVFCLVLWIVWLWKKSTKCEQ